MSRLKLHVLPVVGRYETLRLDESQKKQKPRWVSTEHQRIAHRRIDQVSEAYTTRALNCT